MWVMSKSGFYSIVENREDPSGVLIRARDEDDIQNIEFMLNHAEAPVTSVIYTPEADYPYRIYCSKYDAAHAIAVMVNGIDYDNFKNKIKEMGHKRHAIAYTNVWADMLAIDDRRPFTTIDTI